MCGFCNRRHNRDPFPYMGYMQEKYGPDAVEELNASRSGRRKVTDDDLRRTLGACRAMC